MTTAIEHLVARAQAYDLTDTELAIIERHLVHTPRCDEVCHGLATVLTAQLRRKIEQEAANARTTLATASPAQASPA